MRILTSTTIFLLFISSSFGQVGGRAAYEFLNLPVSARAASLGGNLISVKDNDLNLGITNPALLNSKMDNSMIFSYVNYFADVNYGYAGYSKTYEDLGSFSLGMNYINYGKFLMAEANGDISGEFSAGEYALNFGFGKEFGKYFSYGANVKFAYSQLEQMKSFGLALDLGGNYFNEETGVGAAVLARNVGKQIIAYRKGNPQFMPTELQFAISKKLANAPFRFSLAFENAQRLRMIPADTSQGAATLIPGEEQKREGGFFNNTLRHLVPGVEILPGKSFNIRVGYNLQRAQELKVDARPGVVGFSWGFGLKIKRFNLSYARASYHLAGASNHFTITTNFSSGKK